VHHAKAYALIMGMVQDIRSIEENNTKRRANILGLTYHDTSSGDKALYKDLLNKDELYQYRIVPIQVDQHRINFGVTNTSSQQNMQMLQKRFQDQSVSFSLISDTGYREFMKLYDPPKKVEYQDIALNTAGSDGLVQQVSATLDSVRADDMLAYLTQQAHRLLASDIHIENQNDHVRIRFRIDGVLHPIAHLSKEKYIILRSAIASAGNISTSSDTAQQGHIAQQVQMADGNHVDINLRIESVPTIHGMDVVMRLFSMSADMYNLDRLGLDLREREIIDRIISKPAGLVLAVGPTGSGKTTTLYSMLNSLNSSERKIVTVEDPVEYQFPGIVQIPVTSKNSSEQNFADQLRAILRIDPDIVMVGEIRDLDTAKTALQASLTGHLVLSTFHASSASAALTRLMDVIEQNPLFLSGIRLITAQRLLRRLDDNTKQLYDPDMATLELLQQTVNSLPSNYERPSLEGLKLYKAGSSEENPYGYSNQVAVRELLIMDDKMQHALSENIGTLTTEQVEKTATENGMKTMLQDATLKVIAGQTTLEEVYRVLG
jgi:type IV pilus assembly protein PilB